MVETPTSGLKNHPPRAAPTIPTTTLSSRVSWVRMTVLAAHPINPPTTSHMMMFIECMLQLAAGNYPACSGGVCTPAYARPDRLPPRPVLQGGFEGRRERTSLDCFNPIPLRACKFAASAPI